MATLVTTHDFLSAYSHGEIGSREAMRGIGVGDRRTFLTVLVENGHHLPRGRGEETDAEIAILQPILEAILAELEASSAPAIPADVAKNLR